MNTIYLIPKYGKVFVSIIAVSLFLLISCNKNDSESPVYLDKPQCSVPFTPKSYQYQVVAFYPSWKQSVLPVDSIPWDKLTRITYAFSIPNADGTIGTNDLTMIDKLVTQAHANGVEVYLSVGGGSGSGNFPILAENNATRSLFINEVRQYVFAHCLDGVDIDWEHWSSDQTGTVVPDESNALVSVVKELYQELSPFNLGLSIDLGGSDWWGKDYYDEITDYVNDLQVMAYDFSGPWSAPGPHSSFEQAIGSGSDRNSTGLAYYVNYRHWPKQHILLGVPFYGYNFDMNGGTGIDYNGILNQFPDAYKSDQVNNIYYNGIVTMSKKTQYVVDNGFSGIMIWELSQDSRVDSVSLLYAIRSVLTQ
jgi:chitinase